MKRYLLLLVLVFFVIFIFLPAQVAAVTIQPTSTNLGNNCTTSGLYSTALGYETSAVGDYSFAMGRNIKTIGAYSTAIGRATSGTYTILSSNTFSVVFEIDNLHDFNPELFVKDGAVGLGTSDPQYPLDVIGDIRATGSVYYGGSTGSTDGIAYTKPDYVFEEGYQILSTEQVAKHLEKKKSLPWITPLKKEKEENGEMIDMTRMSFETVETVENLQLQIIALSKIIKEQQRQIDSLLNEAKH